MEDQQLAAERQLIADYEQQVSATVYPNSQLGSSNFRLISYRTNDGADEIRNPAFLQFLRSILLATTTLVPLAERTLPDKARNWLKTLRILSSGKYGQVLSSGIHEISSFYALKYSISPIATIDHEYAVGIILNRLRDSGIPNFAYTYYRIACTQPLFTIDGSIADWCRPATFEAPSTTYLIIENVSDSTSLESLLKDGMKFRDFLTVFYQFSRSLLMARRQVSFTHWDAHPGNILIRRVFGRERTMVIQYGSEYVALRGLLVVLIDYGMSSVAINGEVIGPPSGIPSNFTGAPNYYADIYRFLIGSFLHTVNSPVRTLDRTQILNWISEFLPLFWDNTTVIPVIANEVGLATKPSKQFLTDNLSVLGTSESTDQLTGLYSWLKVDDALESRFPIESFLVETNEAAIRMGVSISDLIQSSPGNSEIFNCSSDCSSLTTIESVTRRPIDVLQACYAVSGGATVSLNIGQLINSVTERANFDTNRIIRTRDRLTGFESADFSDLSRPRETLINFGADVYAQLTEYAHTILQYWLTIEDYVLLVRECECVGRREPRFISVAQTFGEILNPQQAAGISQHLVQFTGIARTFLDRTGVGPSNDDPNFNWLLENLSLVVYTIQLPFS